MRWSSLAMVTESQVAAAVAAGLCDWRGADLVVHGYDAIAEGKVKACRTNGRRGGRPRKERKTQAEPNDKPRANRTVISSTKPRPNLLSGSGSGSGSRSGSDPGPFQRGDRNGELRAGRGRSGRKAARSDLSLRWEDPDLGSDGCADRTLARSLPGCRCHGRSAQGACVGRGQSAKAKDGGRHGAVPGELAEPRTGPPARKRIGDLREDRREKAARIWLALHRLATLRPSSSSKNFGAAVSA